MDKILPRSGAQILSVSHEILSAPGGEILAERGDEILPRPSA
ncbi:hypothetical protein [uncultured Campylobacter sp.]|nr:hypothetical protein [uncultured Campylobacter sp.]